MAVKMKTCGCFNWIFLNVTELSTFQNAYWSFFEKNIEKREERQRER